MGCQVTGNNQSRLLDVLAFQGFSPQNMANVALSRLPVNMAFGISAASYVANIAGEATSAYFQPRFAAEREISSAAIAGAPMRGFEQVTTRALADIQGTLGIKNAVAQTLEWIPGMKALGDVTFRKYAEDAAAVWRASAVQEDLSRRGALFGSSYNLIPGSQKAMSINAIATLATVGGTAGQLTNVFDFNAMYESGRTKEEIGRGFSITAGAAYQSGSTDIRQRLRSFRSGVNNDRSLYSDIATRYAEHNDVNSVYGMYTGGQIDASGLDRGLNLIDRRMAAEQNLAIAGYATSSALSGASFSQATGGGYKAVQSFLATAGANIDVQISHLQSLRSSTTDVQQQAQYQAQIDALAAQKAQQAKGGVELEYGQRGAAAGATTAGARVSLQAGLTTGAYGGALDRLFVGVAGGLGSEASILEEKANRADIYSESERQGYASQAAQLRYQAGIGTAREAAGVRFGQAVSGAGVTSSIAGIQFTGAQLFGGGVETGKSYQTSAQGFSEALDAITQRLREGNLTLEERNRLEGQAADATRGFIEATSRAATAPSQIAAAVSYSQAGQVSQQVQREFIRGAGGVAGVGLAGKNVASLTAAATSAYTALEAKRQNIVDAGGDPQTNPDYQQQKAQYEGLLTQREQANAALSGTPISLGSRRAEAALGFEANVLTRTYASFGNLRANYEAQLRNYGGQLRELRGMRSEAMHQGTWTEAMQAEYEQRQYEIGNRAITAQQGLEQGWMDRLISQTYNAPGSFGVIASQFTRKEAAPFLQNINSAFGFTDANTRDYYLTRGVKLAGSLIGRITRPDGFLATAMAGGGGGGDAMYAPGSPMSHDAYLSSMAGGGREIVIRVIVQTDKGNVLTDQSIQNHANNNGARVLTGPMTSPGRSN